MSSELPIEDVLGRGGILSRRLDGFRERPQQVEMAEAVLDALREEAHLVVEAPTGVGKSLAYLAPVLIGAVATGRKVVISTHTIALQAQLLEKDIPLLASCLPIEFTVTKALGRNNYLGLRRLGLAMERAPDLVADDPAVVALRRVHEWSEDAFEGRRQELDPPVRPEIWDQVQSETDNCLGHRCEQFKRCYYQAARRRLQTADVIVTNHALYCTDLMLRQQDMGILPEHPVLIIDEAHHLERVAQDHLGLSLSRRGMRHFLRRLLGGRGAQGLLKRLDGDAVDGAQTLARKVGEAGDRFFGDVDRWCASRPGSNGRYREPGLWDDVLSADLAALADRLEILADAQERDEVRVEVEAFARRSLAMCSMVRSLLAVDDPDLVYFVERDPVRRHVELAARPLDIAPILERDLFDKLGCVVSTSATLAAGRGENDLGYFARRHGCSGARQLVLGSPFDYQRLVEVHVPRHIPFPDEDGYDEAAADVVLRYIDKAGGGAFVLFTSYRALEASWRRLAGPINERGLMALRQGDTMDRATMLTRFREDGNGVLFGTESFWHGVDVPGSALRLVVITRLPFPVPTLPLNEARAERLRRGGEDPFPKFFLPEAVIRFRQGCGRLVRTEEDEGVILCLDRRVVERPYGKRFRATLADASWDTGVEDAAEDSSA
ncbi:MAG: DEAD/DEAH box helicase [Planctomycetes bacterium]|nr:DEAD/DEAH box helicase [Planctomycetota bacterium]